MADQIHYYYYYCYLAILTFTSYCYEKFDVCCNHFLASLQHTKLRYNFILQPYQLPPRGGKILRERMHFFFSMQKKFMLCHNEINRKSKFELKKNLDKVSFTFALIKKMNQKFFVNQGLLTFASARLLSNKVN